MHEILRKLGKGGHGSGAGKEVQRLEAHLSSLQVSLAELKESRAQERSRQREKKKRSEERRLRHIESLAQVRLAPPAPSSEAGW
jgi:TolA-binding protein